MKHLLAALACAGTLSGCGGGIYVGVGSGYDDPPAVSLVISATQAQPGQALRLTAAASDDDGVARVDFYRLDADGNSSRLCRETVAPYDCDSTLPVNAVRGSFVRYYARATDTAGYSSDSALVSVRVS